MNLPGAHKHKHQICVIAEYRRDRSLNKLERSQFCYEKMFVSCIIYLRMKLVKTGWYGDRHRILKIIYFPWGNLGFA